MCGIIGCVGRGDDTLNVLVEGLQSLEYRGYDSAGVALNNGQLNVRKCKGQLQSLRDSLQNDPLTGHIGIGHTRWSTHGPPTDANAHPHTDWKGRVAVVHNGIIENYQELKDELQERGIEFESDTDTEVVPHLIGTYLDEGDDPETAFRRAVGRLEGSYAFAVVFAGVDALFAVRRGSPLVLGIDDDATYLASDVPAFVEYTRDVVYLEDDQIAVLRPDGWTTTDRDGELVSPERATVDYTAEATGKSGYDHYMLKEIHEQPSALRQCLSGRVDELNGRIVVDELEELETPSTVQLVACGTSYHAALYGVGVLRASGIPAEAFLASEYATAPPPLPDDALVVGITQSGETADTLSALREAKSRGGETLALTNVVGSSAARECDYAFYIRAGPEISVAATKSFSSQLVALNLFVEQLLSKEPRSERRELVSALRDLPGLVQQVLDETKAKEVVEEYLDRESYFFIGRGYTYPVALEGALKFKEITYEHAEGFAAGELKHGPLALVTEETPVFAIVTGNDERARKTVGNIKEVEARDAPVIAVTDGKSDAARYADYVLQIPEAHERVAPVLANVQLQLVAYYMADALGRPIDKPRNLAKSVTVE